jgi:hypothetical protein
MNNTLAINIIRAHPAVQTMMIRAMTFNDGSTVIYYGFGLFS